MTRTRPQSLLIAVAALTGFALACTTGTDKTGSQASPAPAATATTGERAEATAKDAGQKIENAAEKTAEAAKELARDVKREAGPTAREIGQEAKEAGKAAVDVADAKKQALDIKAALMADQSIDSSRIDVDADAKTNTIHISGTVPTAAQKTAVERIAKQKAAGYTIHNMLTVEARTTSR